MFGDGESKLQRGRSARQHHITPSVTVAFSGQHQPLLSSVTFLVRVHDRGVSVTESVWIYLPQSQRSRVLTANPKDGLTFSPAQHWEVFLT